MELHVHALHARRSQEAQQQRSSRGRTRGSSMRPWTPRHTPHLTHQTLAEGLPVRQCCASRSAAVNTAATASPYSASSYSSAVRTSSRRRPPLSLQAAGARRDVSMHSSSYIRSHGSGAAASHINTGCQAGVASSDAQVLLPRPKLRTWPAACELRHLRQEHPPLRRWGMPPTSHAPPAGAGRAGEHR